MPLNMGAARAKAQQSQQNSQAGAKPNSGAQPNAPKEPKLVQFYDFIARYKPPEYRIAGIVQRSRFYSLTGITGHGKTAVCLRLAVHEALGLPLLGRNIDQGNVLYFAAENPDDARARGTLMADRMSLDGLPVPVYFIDSGFNIHDWTAAIRRQAEALDGKVSSCYIDTSPAFQAACGFTDENDNVQAFTFARTLRSFTELPGHPSVVGLTHPIKSATDRDSLIPRGGGAYIAEVDGNLTVWADGDRETTDLHWTGKLRGPTFDPLTFVLESGTCPKLLDCYGRPVPSVWAYPTSQDRAEAAELKHRLETDDLLIAMLEAPDHSLSAWAKLLGWLTDKAEPQKYRVQRILKRLKDQGLAHTIRDQWTLTRTGKTEAEKVKERAAENGKNRGFPRRTTT